MNKRYFLNRFRYSIITTSKANNQTGNIMNKIYSYRAGTRGNRKKLWVVTHEDSSQTLASGFTSKEAAQKWLNDQS